MFGANGPFWSQKWPILIKEHRQKTLVTPSRFWPLRGWRVWEWGGSERIRANILWGTVWANILSDIFERSSKNLWKMIPADVKANKPKRNKRSGGCNLKMFYYLQNLKNNVRKVCIFHLILLDILSILILSVRNKGRGEGFCLTDKIC